MRTNQMGLRVEIFDEEKPIQFSIYSDSNDLHETLNKLFRALYDRLVKDKNLESYEDFVASLTFDIEPNSGVCETYDNVFDAGNKIEGD